MPSMWIPSICGRGAVVSHFDNLLRHASVNEHLLNGSPPVPIHVRLEVTECCNMRCRFCVWHDSEISRSIAKNTTYTGSASLPPERLASLVGELKETGTQAISFTGAGDPLVYPHIEKILRLVDQLGIQFAVTSNFAMPLSDSLIEILCKAAWIRISMNAASPKMYGRIHAPVEKDHARVFSRLQDNIRRLVAARRASVASVRINTSFVVSDDNGNEVTDAASLARSLGCDSISFRPDDPNILGSEPMPFSAAVLRQLLFLESLKCTGFGVTVASDDYERRRRDIRGLTCRYAHHTAYIAATGEVYPCCYTRYDRRFALGNIMATPFHSFWWSERHREKLQGLQIELCPSCPYDDTNIRLGGTALGAGIVGRDRDNFI